MTNSTPILIFLAFALSLPGRAAAASQTIVFPPIPNQFLGSAPFQISAQASSHLPVTLASTTPNVCTIAATQVALVHTGQCSLTASQPGNATYSAAAPVTRSFSVVRTNPAGTLAPSLAPAVALGSAPEAAAVGDFNGDGVPDIVVANSLQTTNGAFGNTITVLLADGIGGFAPAPGSPMVGDFNRDGIPDLATAGGSAPARVSILLGDGSGGFTPSARASPALGSYPFAAVVGDFNGDGAQDLAILNYVSTNLSVLLGDGAGGFTSAPNSPVALAGGPHSIIVNDFNQDGLQDLAITSQTDHTVWVLLGNGAGTFRQAPGSPFPVGAIPDSVTAGDFNGDGFTDLAAANLSDNTVTILLGNAAGSFTPAAGGPFPVGSQPIVVLAADFNGDGILDLATANYAGNNLTVLSGGPASTTSVLTAPPPLTIASGSPVTLDVAVSDNAKAFFAPTGTVRFLDGTKLLGTAPQISSPYELTSQIFGAGAHTITAVYVGDAGSLGSTSNAITIQVNPVSQTISFAPLSDQTLGMGPIPLTATATSGLTVTFVSNSPSVCTVSGTQLNRVAPGPCSITASQSGNVVYSPAAPGTQSFRVILPAPLIAPGGVVPVYSSTNTIQPGSWISIDGSNLASSSATWAGDFPQSLNGTSVTIDGKAAYLWFVGPGQINLQAPDDTARGSVPVVVTTAAGSYNSTVTLAQFAPSFCLLDGKHVAGIIVRPDGSYDILGPGGGSLPYPTVAAKAGDSVALFGVGFGPTNPAVLAGQTFSASAPTIGAVGLIVNTITIAPSFAGLTGAGLLPDQLHSATGIGNRGRSYSGNSRRSEDAAECRDLASVNMPARGCRRHEAAQHRAYPNRKTLATFPPGNGKALPDPSVF